MPETKMETTVVIMSIPTKYLADVGGYLYMAMDRADANEDYHAAIILERMMNKVEGAIK